MSSRALSSWNDGAAGRWSGFGMLLPALLWVGVLVVAPNAFLLLSSFYTTAFGAVDKSLSLSNYERVLQTDALVVTLQRTLLIALAVGVAAVLIAYPLAYIVRRKLKRGRTLALALVVLPLAISYLMRIFSWRIILGENGILNYVLTSTGIREAPSSAFLYSLPAVILTLTYVAIPFVFIATYVMLERIPDSVFEAAHDCGASRTRTLRDVIWPLSLPGVAVGFSIAFILAFGDYVTPAMVGGFDGTMVGSIVLQQFGYVNDWAFGAATGISIMLAALLVLALTMLFTRSEARYDF